MKLRGGHQVISVALGGPTKPTGLAVIEPWAKYSYLNGDESRLDEPENYFDVRWLERLPPGREYPVVLSRIREVISQKRIGRDHSLLVDISATGPAAIRFFEGAALYPYPLRVSDAEISTFQEEVRIVPRKDMITAAQVALQSDPIRLRVTRELELAATLVTDLQAFDPDKTDNAQNTDLITAVAMTIWWGKDVMWSDEVAENMLQLATEAAELKWGSGANSVTGY